MDPAMSGSLRRNMLSQSFNLRAEVAAALLEREEDMRQHEADAGSALSPPFSATYRVLDMSTPRAGAGAGAGAAAGTPSETPAAPAAGDARERRPQVEIYAGASTEVPWQPRAAERQPPAPPAAPESPVGGLVTARPRRLSGSLAASPAGPASAASAAATKKRLRRVSAPTTSLEYLEEQAAHPPAPAPAASAADLHGEVIEDVAQHLTLVPSLHTQWARWRLYRAAEEHHEHERRESLSRALSSWQHEAQVNAAAASRAGDARSRFSRKAVRRLVRLRVEYGREVDTARWRLSSWSWFAKQRSLRRAAVDMLARRAAAEQLRRLLARWRRCAARERALGGALAARRLSRARRCVRAWREHSARNLNRLLCLEWLRQHKLRARLRRCFERWRHAAQLTLLRTDLLFARAASRADAGGAGGAFHLSMYAVLRTWRGNARYQARVQRALGRLRGLRAARAARAAVAGWRASASAQRAERAGAAARLLERELAEKVNMLEERRRSAEDRARVWESERRGYEERLRSAALTNENLVSDARLQSAAAADGGEREAALRREAERLRALLAERAAEKEAAALELDAAARRAAELEQRCMREETKVAVEARRGDDLVHELDVVRSRLANEERQSALALERSGELQHLLDTESKRNADLVDAVRRTEAELRDAERGRSDGQRRAEELEARLGDAAASRAALEASVREGRDGLAAAAEGAEDLRRQLAAAHAREREASAGLAAAGERAARLEAAAAQLEAEKGALAEAKAALEVDATRAALAERKQGEVLRHRDAEIAELGAQRAADESKVRKLLVTVTELRETVTSLKSDLVMKDEVSSNLAAAREAAGALREDVRARDETISEQQREGGRLRNELIESEARAEALAAELARLRAQAEAERSESRSGAERLASELSALKASHTELGDEKARLDMRLHETETRLRSAEDMMVQDETLLHEAKSELLDVKQMLDSAESERTIKSGEVDKLREETARLAESCERHRQAELETTLRLQNLVAEKAVLEQGHQIELGKLAELRVQYNGKMMELTTQQTLAEESRMRAEANATSLAKVREKLVHEEKAHNEMIAILSQEKDGLLQVVDDQREKIRALQAEVDAAKATGGAHSPMTPSIIKRQQEEIASMRQTIRESNSTISELRRQQHAAAGADGAGAPGPSSPSGAGGRKRNAAGRKKSAAEDERLQQALSDAQSLSRDVKGMQ